MNDDDISWPSATDILKNFAAFPVGQQLDVLLGNITKSVRANDSRPRSFRSYTQSRERIGNEIGVEHLSLRKW